jgi:cholesterol transport system auxiliary component
MTRPRPPSTRPSLILGLVLALVAGALTGCISLFPKEAPVQLYRFAYSPAQAAPAASPGGPSFTVRAVISQFDRSASGDRILTTQGETVSYIAGARWVETADSLMEEAMHAAFIGRGPAAVFARGELGPSDYRLTLAVTTFEARYLRGQGAPPTVVVAIDADLDKTGDPATRRARVFRAEVPAESNTVTAMVGAFDAAVHDVLDQLVGWTEAKGSS